MVVVLLVISRAARRSRSSRARHVSHRARASPRSGSGCPVSGARAASASASARMPALARTTSARRRRATAESGARATSRHARHTTAHWNAESWSKREKMTSRTSCGRVDKGNEVAFASASSLSRRRSEASWSRARRDDAPTAGVRARFFAPQTLRASASRFSRGIGVAQWCGRGGGSAARGIWPKVCQLAWTNAFDAELSSTESLGTTDARAHPSARPSRWR